eukprot:11700708-Alexandrium_andersonii.AAC.1
MAPGPCTCGGWYAKHSCTNPQCPSPEGPTGRSLRLERAAAEAREVMGRAVNSGVPNASQFMDWSAALDRMAAQARADAREARRANELGRLPRIA